MSDQINRADAIDTVEELNRKVNDGTGYGTICTPDVLRRINALPSADAVEVVRCKDCVYCTVQNTKYIYAICQRHGIEFKPFEDDTRTHFCAWGERREP